MAQLRKYAPVGGLVAGAAGADLIRFSLRVAGEATFATGADWSPAAGDCKISLDGGAEANVTALPTYVNGSWALALSAAELTAKVVRLRISDAAVDDWDESVETFGAAAATWPDAYSSLLLGTPATAGGLAGDIAALETGGGGPTAAEVADAVWDESLAAHGTAGTAGRALILARAQAKGKWEVAGDQLLLYDVNNTTLLATFTLAPAGGFYTSRVATAE